MENPRINHHIPELDGLRGIAVAAVVLLHARPESIAMLSGPLPGLYKLLGLGGAGVSLFFVLSGFLITGILLDTKGSPGYFRAFYIRRALRIFPLYPSPLLHSFG